MLQIVLMAMGLGYLFKRPKLANLSPGAFPAIDPADFETWKKLELRSIDLFLLATWGVAILSFFVGLLLRGATDDIQMAAIVVVIALTLGGVVASAIVGSRAARFKKVHSIPWPK